MLYDFLNYVLGEELVNPSGVQFIIGMAVLSTLIFIISKFISKFLD